MAALSVSKSSTAVSKLLTLVSEPSTLLSIVPANAAQILYTIILDLPGIHKIVISILQYIGISHICELYLEAAREGHVNPLIAYCIVKPNEQIHMNSFERDLEAVCSICH